MFFRFQIFRGIKNLSSGIKFQVISDIHLEKVKYNNKILEHPVRAENLILAGDIGNPMMNNYREYIRSCSHQYRRVFLIAGNHEYWNNSYDGANKLIMDICDKYKNVNFLNNRFIDFYENNRSVSIFGGTLWSKILENHELFKMSNKSGDNRLISDFNFIKRNKIFDDTVKKISSRRCDIVITHHAPTYKLVHSKYRMYKYNNLFVSNVEYLLNNVNYWCCGHLHRTNDLSKYNDKNLNKIVVNSCHDVYVDKVICL